MSSGVLLYVGASSARCGGWSHQSGDFTCATASAPPARVRALVRSGIALSVQRPTLDRRPETPGRKHNHPSSPHPPPASTTYSTLIRLGIDAGSHRIDLRILSPSSATPHDLPTLFPPYAPHLCRRHPVHAYQLALRHVPFFEHTTRADTPWMLRTRTTSYTPSPCSLTS